MTPRWVLEAGRLDAAVYDAVTQTPTPSLDEGDAASDAGGQLLAAVARLRGGARRDTRFVRPPRCHPRHCLRRGRLGGRESLIKPLARRRRPDSSEVLASRRARVPEGTSFPSGHAASAFAFATGVGSVLPVDAIPIRALASLVAYSRVHTGVHYPADVVAGAFLGTTIAQLVCRGFARS